MTEYVITYGYTREGKFIRGLCRKVTFTDRRTAIKKYIAYYDEGLKGIEAWAGKAKKRRLSNHFECQCEVYKDGKYNSMLTTNFLMQSLSVTK